MPAIRARIVQISDLHINRHVRTDVMGMLKQLLGDLNPSPDALIVSGDLANQPVPPQMKKAAELVREIAAACRAKRVIVIPGNHDFKFWGNVGLRRLTRIPFEMYFRPDRAPGWRALAWDALRWKGTALREPVTFVDMPESGIALFTINSNTLTEMMAAGKVEMADLRELYRMAKAAEAQPEFAFRYKIAVVHHHPAPIANAPEDAMARLQDSFMMFYNAGLFVQELSRRGFNLVLHGHKHVAGFLRLGCDFPELGRTVLPVAAAGTACHPVPDDERGHHFHVVDILDDDTATLDSYFFDAKIGRKDDVSCRYDLDTLRDVRRRRHAIFRRVQKRTCHEVRKTETITRDGYTEVRIEHLNCRSTTEEGLTEIPLSLVAERPMYIRDVEKAETASAFIKVRPRERTTLHQFQGVLDLGERKNLQSGSFDYAYQFRLMNGHVLDANEFVRHYFGTERESESVSITCDVACDLMVLTVHFPENYDLDSIEVRPVAEYVKAPLTGVDDIRLDSGDPVFRHDAETERISRSVHRDALGFVLTCPEPVPGLIYNMHWKYLDSRTREIGFIAEAKIAEAKRNLLAVANEAKQGNPEPWTLARNILEDLARDVGAMIPGPPEHFNVNAMIFDDEVKRLKFATANSDPDEMPSGDFYSGEGCAGFAFEKARSVVVYPTKSTVGHFIFGHERPEKGGLADPVVLASFPWIANLSDERRRSVVGVINVSSRNKTTKLLALFDDSKSEGFPGMELLHYAVNLAGQRLLEYRKESV